MGEGLKRAAVAAKATRVKKTPADKRREAGMPEPAKGQVWEGMDKREPARELTILSIAKGKATVRSEPAQRTVTISVDRLVPGSTGYRYLRG